MKRLILVGSPRVQGRSAKLADLIFETNIEERPQDELFLVPVSEIDVGFCIGCDACKEKTEVILKSEDGKEVSTWQHRCVFDDDMQTVYDLINDVDEIIAVVPVYFSGSPAPFKCLLDRLQPYFWTDFRQKEKRPLILHVVGEGGDPHGYDALVSEVKSAFSVAGFKLERIFDWVGRIDTEGEIIEEAKERTVDAADVTTKDHLSKNIEEPGVSQPKVRPKLSLNSVDDQKQQKESGRSNKSNKVNNLNHSGKSTESNRAAKLDKQNKQKGKGNQQKGQNKNPKRKRNSQKGGFRG